MGTEAIANIPNINDNPLYYATLQCGVLCASSEMYNNEALGVGYSDRQAMSGMNINGGEAGNADVQVDGLSVQGAGWHESTQLPNRDALQEVTVTTNTLSADLGGGLGVIQLITKSGTNQFHGDLAYRMRNEAFNANGTSNDVQGIPKGKYRLNEESGAVGGPVVIPHLFNGRDKVFFFGSFSRDTHPSTVSGFYTVPTALERTGDYSASSMRDQNGNPIPAQMYNPWTAVPYQGSSQVFQRTEYPKGPSGPGDFIPNPDAPSLTILGAYPLPNHTPINAFNDNNFYFSGVSTVIRDNLNTRLDVHLIPKHSIYASGGVQLGSAGIVNPVCVRRLRRNPAIPPVPLSATMPLFRGRKHRVYGRQPFCVHRRHDHRQSDHDHRHSLWRKSGPCRGRQTRYRPWYGVDGNRLRKMGHAVQRTTIHRSRRCSSNARMDGRRRVC